MVVRTARQGRVGASDLVQAATGAAPTDSGTEQVGRAGGHRIQCRIGVSADGQCFRGGIHRCKLNGNRASAVGHPDRRQEDPIGNAGGQCGSASVHRGSAGGPRGKAAGRRGSADWQLGTRHSVVALTGIVPLLADSGAVQGDSSAVRVESDVKQQVIETVQADTWAGRVNLRGRTGHFGHGNGVVTHMRFTPEGNIVSSLQSLDMDYPMTSFQLRITPSRSCALLSLTASICVCYG